MTRMARPGQASPRRPGLIAMTPGSVDIRAIRRHFTFGEAGRIATNNAASTQPPRELLALYRSLAPGYENVHCKKSPAGFWVSRGTGTVVRRPWCLACSQELDRIHCDITPFGGSRARTARQASVQ